MDVLLFLVGIYCLIRKLDAYVLAIIVFLASQYFQISLDEYTPLLSDVHTDDLGILLYLCFFIKTVRGRPLVRKSKIAKCTTFLLIYIVANGVLDVFLGTSVIDVVKELRHYIFYTFVYIYPYVKQSVSVKSLKIVYYIAMFMCLILLLQRFTDIDILPLRVDEGRGNRPISYCIYCSCMVLINVWKFPVLKRILHFIIFFLPIVLCMKFTYFGAVFLTFGIYIFFSPLVPRKTRIGLAVSVPILFFLFLFVASSFRERMTGMLDETSSISAGDNEGNFSFRILHSAERFIYIIQSPLTAARGIGYVQEQNFKETPFIIGLPDKDGKTIQLDTGDIAWSLFFVRFGLIGIGLYLFLYFTLAKEYYHRMIRIRRDKFAAYYFSMMMAFLFWDSLGNALIFYSDFFIYPFLFLQYINKQINTFVESRNVNCCNNIND